MVIRDATKDDLPAIVAIYNEAIPEGRATADLEPIMVESRHTWFQEFDPDRRPCWVAEDEGEVVGCVYLRSFYAGRSAYQKTAEISTYLASSHQGRGLGTELKKRMIEACPRLGVENLLSFYFDHNEASRRVNEKLGFRDAAHLEEIAEVFGEKRGLVIAILRINGENR
ncbi:MAG: GNAT family N-acetyltransferase [Akkermansiaceae bacterium]